MPFGSCAHNDAFGIPFARLPASGFAFQGLLKSPTTTSFIKLPFLSGTDQGQQNPAVNLPEYPSLILFFIACSSLNGSSNILKSKSSLLPHNTFAVFLTPKVLFIQLTNASEPL